LVIDFLTKNSSHPISHQSHFHQANLTSTTTTFTTTAIMKRNVVIFLIILILFILIALIAYMIYYLQTRMAVGGTASSVSDMTEP
jgi:hypothetical protein